MSAASASERAVRRANRIRVVGLSLVAVGYVGALLHQLVADQLRDVALNFDESFEGWVVAPTTCMHSALITGAIGIVIVFVAFILAMLENRRSAEPVPAQRSRLRGQLFVQVGIPTLILIGWLLVGAGIVSGIITFVLALFGVPLQSAPAWVPLVVYAPGLLVSITLSTWLLLRMRRVPRGTSGLLRLGALSWGTIIQASGWLLGLAMLTIALTDSGALGGGVLYGGEAAPLADTFGDVYTSLVDTMAGQGTLIPLIVFLSINGLGGLIQTIGFIGSWFLIPLRYRVLWWAFFDTFLAALFIVVTLTLPIVVPEGANPAFASIRLSITTVAGIRLLLRMLGPMLDLVELGGFRLLAAARLMRTKRSGFLSAVGFFSILAVSVSTCMLTSVLSVMGGFRNDLQRKILGNNAHVVVDRQEGTFEGWTRTLEVVREQPEVLAATPYVQGDVMITSATNLGGAIIRGIDPDTIGDVTELDENMRHGSLDYLRDPERLLRLRGADMRRDLLSPPLPDAGTLILPGGTEPDFPFPEQERGSLFDDMDDIFDGVAPQDSEHEESDRIQAEIDDLLGPAVIAEPDADIDLEPDGNVDPEAELDANPDRAPPGGYPDDLLPGLIVGQELARSLRLHLGDEVNVVSPLGDLGPNGLMPRTRPFRIAGIFYSGMYEFDMKMAYMTLESSQRFLNVGDAITGIEVKVNDTEQAESIAENLSGAIERPELRVRGWQEVNRNLFGALQLEKLAMFIMLGIAILVASFCIVGTLLLMVQEKGKEVGILKAMGATGAQIVAVFMAQGLMIGVLGAAIGLGLGFETCFIMENFGIHLNPDVYYIDKLPVHIDATEFFFTGIAAVIVCLLSTVYPAILGSRLRPVDSLRYT